MGIQTCIIHTQVIVLGTVATATGWRGPSALSSDSVCIVYCSGIVSCSSYYSTNYSAYSARPVVSIPRSEVNIAVSGTGPSATLSLNKV